MNYIILSSSAAGTLEERYRAISRDYGCDLHFDAYLSSVLSFDGSFRIQDTRRNKSGGAYTLVGKGCTLGVDEDSYHPNCLYARRAWFHSQSEDYLKRLRRSTELPGCWLVVTQEEARERRLSGDTDIRGTLESLRPSSDQFQEFQAQWEKWDLYNQKLREKERQQEEKSELAVERTVVENDLVTLYTYSWEDCYQPEKDLYVEFENYPGSFRRMGQIEAAEQKNHVLQVRCDNQALLLSCMDGSRGRLRTVRMIDAGSRARITRQRQALEKLFREETANPDLRSILMGGYDFPPVEGTDAAAQTAAGLFGSNIRQRDAYAGALCAQDIFLIQGPPGTGKTSVITAIVKHAVQHGKRVLVSSETNIAVDNVLERAAGTEQLIPVRLGREERISAPCLPYTLPRISDAILQETRRRLESAETELTLDTLLASVKEEYAQKRRVLREAIIEKAAQLPPGVDRRMLSEKIEKFEATVLEVNLLYDGLSAEERALAGYREEERQLISRRAALAARLALAGGAFKSNMTPAETADMRRELHKLDARLRDVREAVEGNRYEAQSASYRRKLRRSSRMRQELAQLTGLEQPFMAHVRRLKELLDGIEDLERQDAQLAEAETAECQRTRLEFVRRKALWARSADIRQEWRALVENREVQQDIEMVYMAQINAVFATCTGFSSRSSGVFAAMEYDYVIVDEAAKCNSLDLLIPLTAGKKIILVGDQKQLYPMLDMDFGDDELNRGLLEQLRAHILFKWLYEQRVPADYRVMLDRQYRMHPVICGFVSQRFYEGKLLCEKESPDQRAMTWIDCAESQEIAQNKSLKNPAEAQVVVDLLQSLDRRYASGTTVGVICTYKAQADLICRKLEKCAFRNIAPECSTVDAFQGKEKHTIILDLTRSSRANGFVADENRVNVAVSRAQEKLFVVGKVSVVKDRAAGALADLYEYILTHGDVRDSRFAVNL